MADEKRVQQTTLGCGTLILIALIVSFFSRPGLRDLEHGVHKLGTDVGNLKNAIDAQTEQIKALQEKVEPVKVKE